MESDRAVLGAAILIAMLVFSNLIMYGIARGATRGSSHDWMKTMQDSLRGANSTKNNEMDELREKIKQLEDDREKDP